MAARRYAPTEEEIAVLVAAGWRYTPRNTDEDAWFWPNGEYGLGWTYKQAIKEQQRREKEAAKHARQTTS